MAAQPKKKTTCSDIPDKALSLVLGYNVAPHPALAAYHKTQTHRLEIRDEFLCRVDVVKSKDGIERQSPVVRNGVTVYVDDAGEAKYYYDDVEANRWIRFIESFCTHAKAKWTGQPLILAPWQKWIIKEFFGWRKVGTKLRRYKYLFLFLPRKNGKSLLIAALALGLLLIDGELTPEVYATASTDEQAQKLFQMALAMIRQNPKLDEKLEGLKGNISLRESVDSFFRPIPFNPDAFHGANPSGVILDEYHVQKTTGMKRVGETGMGAREQPVIAIITTAGNQRGTPCEKEWSYASQIRDGVIEVDNYLPCIFEAPRTADWTDIEVAIACNPNYPESPNRDFLLDEIEKAKRDELVALEYKQLQLNWFIEERQIWIDHDLWLAGREKFDLRHFKNEPLYFGYDLGATDDLTALVIVKPGGIKTGDWYVYSLFWCPEKTIKRKSLYLPYKLWEKQGYLVQTPGSATDYGYIREQLSKFNKHFTLKLGHADRANATWLTTLLNEEDGMNVEFMGQGTLSMTEPIKFLKTLVLSGRLKHFNPILDWMSNNCLCDGDDRAVKFDKADSDSKIDGMVALAMAIAAALREIEKKDELAERGVRFL